MRQTLKEIWSKSCWKGCVNLRSEQLSQFCLLRALFGFQRFSPKIFIFYFPQFHNSSLQSYGPFSSQKPVFLHSHGFRGVKIFDFWDFCLLIFAFEVYKVFSLFVFAKKCIFVKPLVRTHLNISLFLSLSRKSHLSYPFWRFLLAMLQENIVQAREKRNNLTHFCK